MQNKSLRAMLSPGNRTKQCKFRYVKLFFNNSNSNACDHKPETLVNVNAGVNQLKQVLASQYLPKMPKQPILSTLGAHC